MACYTLKNNMFKNIASVLCAKDQMFKNAQYEVIFARTLQTYPSKSIYAALSNRIMHYMEQNIHSIDLIIDIMKEEGEDQELIETAELLASKQTIKTLPELTALIRQLADYVKWAGMLKKKQQFIKAMDFVVTDEDDDDSNLAQKMTALRDIALSVIDTFNSVNVTETQHAFDTTNRNGMANVVAQAKESRKADKVIVTGIKMLNTLISPGYCSGNLYIYAGGPGNYKSGMLLKALTDTLKYNEHLKNTTNGKTPIVMYISMENTMSQTILRIWSLLFPTADISMFSVEEVTDMIDKELTSHGMRAVILYYGYREKSIGDIARIIQGYNDDENEVVLLSLDYIKRVRPTSKEATATSSEKGELNAIMNEIKSMICAQFGIAVVSGHQINRAGVAAINELVAKGGYNRTADALSTANVGSAWEVVEVADALFLLNIENNGETKQLMIKAGKRRDMDPNSPDADLIAIQHPFLSMNSFALRDDIMENVSISTPIYVGKRVTNFMANI